MKNIDFRCTLCGEDIMKEVGKYDDKLTEFHCEYCDATNYIALDEFKHIE